MLYPKPFQKLQEGRFHSACTDFPRVEPEIVVRSALFMAFRCRQTHFSYSCTMPSRPWKAQHPERFQSMGDTRGTPAGEEHGVVSRLWNHIEEVLESGGRTARATIRSVRALLPDAVHYSPQEIQKLVSLHSSSARDLMTALRLMAPEAFDPANTEFPNVAALDTADGELMSMVSALIEMQLFHLSRAGQLLAVMKQRLAVEVAAQVAQLQQEGSDSSTNNTSNNIAQPSSDSAGVQDL